MSKAERLVELTLLLRSRRTAITAESIAELLEVSPRTVYRDIQSLIMSGVPVKGEPGIGYLIRQSNHLPPMIFTADELQALIVGSRMVQAFTDKDLARGARSAELKIRAVLTETLKRHAEQQPYRIPVIGSEDHLREIHGRLRLACEKNRKIRIVYRDEKQLQSERTLWPLGIIGWSGRWTLLAWCELRKDYRNFRFDRIQSLEELENHFTPTEKISLAYYLRHIIGVHDIG